MPRIPDETAFGASPTPQSSNYVPQDSGYENAPAQAMKRLGATLEDASQTVERVQDIKDRYAAEDAYNQLLQKKQELTFGEDGFTQKKGKDAVEGDLVNKYDERMSESIGSLSGNLANPRQQKYFNDRARVAALQYRQDVLRHTTAETDKYHKEVYAAGVETERENAGVRYGEPNAVNASRARTEGLIQQEGEREGWSDEKIKQVKKEAAQAMHITVIQSAVSDKNPKYARSWFEVHKKEIDPSEHAAIERLIKSADLTEFGQAVVDDVITRKLTEQEALAEARKKYSGEEEETAKKEIKTHFAEVRSAANDTGYEIYAETPGTPEQRLKAVKDNITVWDSMSGQAKNALTRQAAADAKGGVPNGGGDYYEILNLMQRDYNAFLALDLKQPVLNDGNRKELMDIQKGTIDPGFTITKTKLMNEMIKAFGGDPNDTSKEKSLIARRKMNEYFDDLQESNGGKPLTKAQKEQGVLDLQIQIQRAGNWNRFFGITDTVAEVDYSRDPYLKDVPKAVIAQYAAEIQRRGMEVNRETILQMHRDVTFADVPDMLRRPSADYPEPPLFDRRGRPINR